MTDTSSRGRGVSATLKGGRDFDAPWIVFTGSVDEVKADIIQAFGFDDDTSNASELDLHDLTVEAAKAFSAQYVVGTTLGGRPAGKRSSGAQKAAEGPSKGSESDDWDEPAPKQEEPAGPSLADLIGQCESVADLKNLWADNTAALSGDPDLLAAWKARGRELSAAA